MIQIDIFCESGEKYGLGHLRRCENLLLLFQKCYPSLNFEATFHALPCAIPQKDLEIIIIDSYIAPLEFYQSLEKRGKVLLCLDDFSRLAYPKQALILSPTYGLQKRQKNFFAGKDYVILHPAFNAPIPSQATRKNHILITLGGSNQNALIAQILESLCVFPDLFFHIISPSFQSKASNIQTYPLLSAEQICSLIDACELVISASGGSLNEALSRRKKVIALCIAKNQKRQLQAYQCSKILFPIFNPFQSLKPKLLYAFDHLKKIPPSSLIYGKKLPKLFRILLLRAITPPNAKAFDFLNQQEKLRILSLRNQQEVREASFHSALIQKKNHLAFLASLKEESLYFAFFKNGKIQGVGYLFIEDATLGIYRDKNAKGFGTMILQALFSLATKLDLPLLYLKVLKKNQHALNFYQKHHFQTIKEEKEYFIMQKTLRNPI